MLERKDEIIFVDDEIVVAVKDKISTPGQITVYPKQHLPIMEMIPDHILKRCGVVANKISIAVFESLGAQGTNILVRNGLSSGQNVPHFGIEIIPRREEDGLNLLWEGKKLMEDEMEMAFDALVQDLKKPTTKPKEKKNVEDGEAVPEEQIEDEETNYLIKSLEKIP